MTKHQQSTEAYRLADYVFAASGLTLGPDAARDLADAIRRAHQSGYDAGLTDGVTQAQGLRPDGHTKAWQGFLDQECPPV